jgi:hypothetical protein
MNARHALLAAAIALIAAPSFAMVRLPGLAPGPTSKERLRAVEDAGHLDLRAGAVACPTPIRECERLALRAAEARSEGLDALRAGAIDISDHDYKLIAIVLGIVLILVII